MTQWIARKALESLDTRERAGALSIFRAGIDARLRHLDEWGAFWGEVQAIVAELKAEGHDLWTWDADGERSALWGWDYMRMRTAGWLQIQFNFGGQCETFWREENERLGVDR